MNAEEGQCLVIEADLPGGCRALGEQGVAAAAAAAKVVVVVVVIQGFEEQLIRSHFLKFVRHQFTRVNLNVIFSRQYFINK